MEVPPKTHKSEVAKCASKLLQAIELSSRKLSKTERRKAISFGLKIGELVEKLLPKIS
jgi:hypothetical protein